MARLSLQSAKKPDVKDEAAEELKKRSRNQLSLSESDAPKASVLSQHPELKAAEGITEVNPQPTGPSPDQKLSLMQSGGNFMAKPGVAQAIGSAGSMVGQTIDPKGTGNGPALSYAAQGAATGTMILPGWGTAIGAAIGLGLGMMKAESNRKENKLQADIKATEIRSKGMENAGRALESGKINDTFAGRRRLRL